MGATDELPRLEANLQTAWDADTAAVYADLLASRGDPRGELIAIDLAARHAWSRELEERRRENLVAWLGGETLCERRWHPRQFEYGLVRDFDVEGDGKDSAIVVLRQLFASPAGAYVRGLQLSGGDTELSQCLDAMAAHGLPWLRRLAVSRSGSQPIANDLANAFAATPHLDELILDGVQVLRSPGHPNVRTLRIVGGDSLVITASPMTWITTLDLAFEAPESFRPAAQEDHVRLAALVNPRTFPALHTLDLSRNDLRRYSRGPHPADSVFPFLDAVEQLARISKVRLPAIHTDEAAAHTLALLARCPDLEVEIARSYVERPERDLVHPRLRVPTIKRWGW